MDKKPLIIGIAGRSCSGKTRSAINLLKKLGKENTRHINVDKFWVLSSYFNCKEPGELERQAIKELKDGLSQLKEGNPAVEFPIYNFRKYFKVDEPPISCSSAQIILVDGTLIFWDEDIRDLIDMKVFIDVPDDICLKRKLEKYVSGKKGTEEYEKSERKWKNHWNKNVSPQWGDHLEPTKTYANKVVPCSFDAVNAVLAYISSRNGES